MSALIYDTQIHFNTQLHEILLCYPVSHKHTHTHKLVCWNDKMIPQRIWNIIKVPHNGERMELILALWDRMINNLPGSLSDERNSVY